MASVLFVFRGPTDPGNAMLSLLNLFAGGRRDSVHFHGTVPWLVCRQTQVGVTSLCGLVVLIAVH